VYHHIVANKGLEIYIYSKELAVLEPGSPPSEGCDEKWSLKNRLHAGKKEKCHNIIMPKVGLKFMALDTILESYIAHTSVCARECTP
jgi:hypothetical protein